MSLGKLDAQALPLWPLPLVAGLLPAVAALLALLVAAIEGRPACNPLVDDCGSISRIARHGLANHLFRTLVLPAGVLQGLTWLGVARALACAGATKRESVVLALLGGCSGIALVVYGGFLGTEGQAYRWLRRWGTMVFFAGGYLAMLVFARAVERLRAEGTLALPSRHRLGMLGLLAFVAVVGLTHGLASVLGFVALEDRIENLTEWWAALALTLNFLVIASLCRRWRLAAAIGLVGFTGEGPR